MTRQNLYQYGGLGVLLALYLLLVSAYSYAIPFSKGPDEYINYQYILFIARHGRLPATIAEKEEAGVKADWQPLYHLLAGAAAWPVSLDSAHELKVTWQPPTRQLIDLVLPRATLVRTEDERPPYRGFYAVWQAGRWVSMALGAATLIVTYFTARAVWPQQPVLAFGATALLVFIPRFLFTHAVLSDDTLLGFCLAVYLLLLVTVIQSSVKEKPPAPLLFVGLGLMAGLAVITKYTAAPVIAGGLASTAFMAYRYRWGWRPLLQRLSLFIGAVVLAAGWWIGWVWWHFNQIDSLGLVMGLLRPLLPGVSVDDNPTTARLTALLSGQTVADLGEAPNAGGGFFDWAWHTFDTLWGVTVFGAEPVWPYYPYLIILIGLALICLLAVAGGWRAYRGLPPNKQLLWQALILHFLIFFPVPLLRFALSRRLNDAAQGRHLLFPAGAAIVILLLAGGLAWVRPRQRGRIAWVSGGLMLIWGIGHLVYLWTAYPPPLPVRTTPGPQLQVEQPTQINFGDIVELSGYQTQLINNGSTLQLDLLWHSLAQAGEDYQTEITLVDQQDQTQLRWLSQPADGRFPVRAWQPGDWVHDTLFIPLAGITPGTYKMYLRLLGWEKPLPSTQGEIVFLSRIDAETIPAQPPLALWQQGKLVTESGPVYRYRAAIPVTLTEAGKVSLAGPNGQTYLPETGYGALQLFTVKADWPSGVYQLQVDNQAGQTTLSVENSPRNFVSPAMRYLVQANFADKIELLGYDLPERRAEAGGGIPLVLYWRGLRQMREDYTIFVQLVDADLQRRGGYDRLPRETYPTYLWVPGEIVDDGFAVPIEADAPPGVYTVRLGWYHLENGQAVSLPLIQAGQPLAETSLVVGPIKIGGPPAGAVVTHFAAEHPLDVDLGQTVALRGYDLILQEKQLQLKLYWQCLARMDVDYTVFVHLRDQAGATIAQRDQPPAAGGYPTSLWDKGEIIPDAITVDLPSEMEPEQFQVVVGLYDPNTGTRLAVPGSADNEVLLTGFGSD